MTKTWGLGFTLFSFTVYGKDYAGNWDFHLLAVSWPFDGRALLSLASDKVVGFYFGALWFPGHWYGGKNG